VRTFQTAPPLFVGFFVEYSSWWQDNLLRKAQVYWCLYRHPHTPPRAHMVSSRRQGMMMPFNPADHDLGVPSLKSHSGGSGKHRPSYTDITTAVCLLCRALQVASTTRQNVSFRNPNVFISRKAELAQQQWDCADWMAALGFRCIHWWYAHGQGDSGSEEYITWVSTSAPMIRAIIMAWAVKDIWKLHGQPHIWLSLLCWYLTEAVITRALKWPYGDVHFAWEFSWLDC